MTKTGEEVADGGVQLSLLPVKKTTFTLPRDLYTTLKIESVKRDVEMSALVTQALQEFFSEETP
jgi:hypothetical protein